MPSLVSDTLYDARSQVTSLTRVNTVNSTYSYSAQRGFLTGVSTVKSATVLQDYTYSRDARGRITGVTSSQAGEGWTYGYDDMDRLLSADNTTDNTLDQTWTYDSVDNMLTNSQVGTYTYPPPGTTRPLAVTGLSGGPLGTQSFTYDNNGAMTDQGGDVRTYDGENRLVSAVDGATTTQFVYGPDGARLKKIVGATTTLYLGVGHKLELPGKASGTQVYADGARFLPSPTLPRYVSWSFTPSSTGTHLVYAKWPAAATHTTEAKFTISHAGGTTDVTVNQRLQGGQWVALGSYTMNASTAYTIALSDNANGQVAADAVRVVPAGASAEKFTWTPAIPSSGSYDVYARWVSSSANTGAATYSVTHSGGTATVIVNQKQNGGAWVKLGTYSLAPSSGHKVELLGAYDGRVVADGIRLVSAGAQAANIAYIHTDHLGSPQKMTDTAQVVNWDAQFEPFGEEFLISGSAVQPNRFPGQYADAETGLNYNYFRDYDPAIGRYIQSDPIGLDGGINLYAYAFGNPVKFTDQRGTLPAIPNPPGSDQSSIQPCRVINICEKVGDGAPPIPTPDDFIRVCKYVCRDGSTVTRVTGAGSKCKPFILDPNQPEVDSWFFGPLGVPRSAPGLAPPWLRPIPVG